MKSIRLGGIGTFIVLALLAIPSFASASTGGFVSNWYPTTEQGTNIGTETFYTTVPISCTSSTFTKILEGPSESLVVTPKYEGCKGAGTGLNVSMNGCTMTFKVSESGTSGTVTIGGAGCGGIRITGLGCEQWIASQTTIATYANESQTFRISGIGNLSYTSSGWACGNGSGSRPYQGEWQVSGKAAYGETAVVQTTGALPVPIYLINNEGTGQLSAAQFPVTLTSTQETSKKDVLKGDYGRVECEEGTLSGSAAAPTSTIELAPSYSGCQFYTIFGNISASVNPNGCKFTYGVSGIGPFSGTANLVCPAGKSYVVSGPGCSVTVPPQQLGSVSYPISAGGAIEFVLTPAKIKYSYTGFTCGSGSNLENGTFSQDRILRGTR